MNLKLPDIESFAVWSKWNEHLHAGYFETSQSLSLYMAHSKQACVCMHTHTHAHIPTSKMLNIIPKVILIKSN